MGRGMWDVGCGESEATGHTSTPTSHIPHPTSQTTDPQHELFDILDAEGRPTGERKARWQVHRDGDWHAAMHIWVYGVRDDDVTFMLFQRRSLSKDTWP